MARTLVICLTKNRPRTLALSLDAVVDDLKRSGAVEGKVVVLDDSTRSRDIALNRRLVRAKAPAMYVGSSHQAQHLRVMKSNLADGSLRFPLLKHLGDPRGTIGGLRNYGLLFGLTTWSPEVIVFLDDDVVLADNSSGIGNLEELASTVGRRRRRIAGGVLEGIPDVSSLERMLLAVIPPGQHDPEFPRPPNVSGGFMALSTDCAALCPFPPWYDEDLVWMSFCRSAGADVVRASKARAIHEPPDVKAPSSPRLRLELFGEIILEAMTSRKWESLKFREAQDYLLHRRTWTKSIEIYRAWVEYLTETLPVGSFQSRVIRDATAILDALDPAQLIHAVSGYFDSCNRWSNLISRLQKDDPP